MVQWDIRRRCESLAVGCALAVLAVGCGTVTAPEQSPDPPEEVSPPEEIEAHLANLRQLTFWR